MESFLNRYRNITVLLLVIFAQLVLLAVQVKNQQNVSFIRVWTVTAVSPLARLMEGMRGGSLSFVQNYITLHDEDAQNRQLKADNDRLKMQVVFLQNELNTADRAKALQLFQQQSPSKTLAATVFSNGIGSGKVVYIDRGSVSGVMREMAVITPDGIVGKVSQVYPTASQVLLITDSDFAAGVVTAKTHVHGILKGGSPLCKVDQVSQDDKVDVGDWFYTSGEDRIFPRGMPVGIVKSVRAGQPFKEILLEPSGIAAGSPDDVLIVLEGVHQEIPDNPPPNLQVYLAPPLPADAPAAAAPAAAPAPNGAPAPAAPPSTGPGTEADKERAMYQNAASSAGIVLGGGPAGTNIGKPPDFTKLPVDPKSVAAHQAAVPPPSSPAVPLQKKATAAPAATPAATPSPAAPSPATKSTAPADKATKSTAPADKATNPDAIRRANQAAGGGGGNQ